MTAISHRSRNIGTWNHDRISPSGTSSWLFDGWRGVFYPEKLPRNQYLAYYATQFATVEVNTSFYALPSPSTLINWVESVPPGFTFALKFPRVISHEKRLSNVKQRRSLFWTPCAPWVPPRRRPSCSCRRTSPAKATAELWPPIWTGWPPTAADLRIAVEVRAADLMTPAFAAFLAERGFALA